MSKKKRKFKEAADQQCEACSRTSNEWVVLLTQVEPPTNQLICRACLIDDLAQPVRKYGCQQ